MNEINAGSSRIKLVNVTYIGGASARSDVSRRIVRYVISWISPTIYSLVLFSAFSIKVFDVGGNYLFEAALFLAIGWGLIARDPIARAVVRIVRYKRHEVIAAFITITALFILGSLIGGNAIYSYADYRANLSILLGFLIFWDFRRRDSLPLIQLGIVTGIISALSWYFQVTGDSLGTKFASPYVCMLVAIVLACESRRMALAALATVLLVFLAAVSFYRQYWISAACGIVYLLSYAASQLENRSRMRLVIIIAAGAIVAIPVAPRLVSKVEDFFVSDQSHYIQAVGKTQNFLDATVSGNGRMQGSDETRFSYFKFIFTNPWKVTLPHGLGYRSFFNDIDPYFSQSVVEVTTIDSLFFYMCFHYGILLTAPFLAWLVRGIYVSRRKRGMMPTMCIAVVMFVALLFDGGQAVVISRAFWLGMLIAMIVHPVKIRI